MTPSNSSDSAAARGEPTATATTPTSSRGIAFRVGSVAVGLLVALLIVEIGLRLAGVEPINMMTKRHLRVTDQGRLVAGYHCYPSNPHQEFQPLPEMTGGHWTLWTYTDPPESLPLAAAEKETPFCVEYRRNRFNLRQDELTHEPAEGVIRIAMVGDSFVFGEGVQSDAALPNQLGELLGERFEVINCAQVGANTEDELEQAYQAHELFDCRRFLLVYLVNDIGLSGELAEEQDYINDLIIFRDRHLQRNQAGAWYKGHLRVLDLAGSRLEMRNVAAQTIDWYRACYDPTRNQANLARMQSFFHELALLPHSRVAVIIYPLLEGLEGDYPFRGVHEFVAKQVQSAGIPVLDLEPSLSGIPAEQLWVHAADHHPNRRAHTIAAKKIAAWLRTEQPAFLNDREVGELQPTYATAEAEQQIEGLLSQAAAAFQQNDLALARQIFTAILARDPQHQLARLYLGIIGSATGELNGSIVHFREALRLNPGWVDALTNLANALVVYRPREWLRDSEEAVQIAEQACVLTDYESLNQLDTLVAAYGTVGQFQQAVDTATWALELPEAETVPHMAALLRQKLAEYQRELARQPPDAMDDLGVSDGEAGELPADDQSPAVEPAEPSADKASREDRPDDAAPAGEPSPSDDAADDANATDAQRETSNEQAEASPAEPDRTSAAALADSHH